MAVLKKIMGSTLMETLVATVLIVIIFMISSLLLNSVFANSIHQNTQEIDMQLLELQYQYQSGQLPLPYFKDTDPWQIAVDMEIVDGVEIVVLEAKNPKTKKTIRKSTISVP